MTVLAAVWRNPSGRIGLVLVALALLVGALGPALSPYDATHVSVLERFQGPSAAHPMGTDQLGRDFATRVAYGTQLAIGVAVMTIAVSLSLGTLLGTMAAFAPRRVEAVILVCFDIVNSFPSLVFALAVLAALGRGIDKVVLIVAITLMPHFGRVARAQALALKNAPFLEAERVLGAGPVRVFGHHVLPNILGPLVVLASMDIPVVVTIEAGLSFLGIGVPPPAPSLGTLLNDGYVNLGRSAWAAIFSGLTLIVITLGFTLFGEALRDAIDPKLKTER
jgi:peptide/nickel transport system permease protein